LKDEGVLDELIESTVKAVRKAIVEIEKLLLVAAKENKNTPA
jgi:hypothetical protein